MVKVRVKEHARVAIARTTEMINDVFGTTYTLRRVTLTYDQYGQIASRTTADTSFVGDLQGAQGSDVDQRLISAGYIEVGDAVLYVSPDALAVQPQPQDLIISGSEVYEIIGRIEVPDLQGSITHYAFRCKRRVNSGDT